MKTFEELWAELSEKAESRPEGSGTVALKASGDDLMSVSLDATLTGPAPFNISGNFKIHILFFDVHTSFSHSWGQEAPAIAATLVDVGQLLSATFADPRSWDARLPSGVSALVAVRQIEDSTVVLAHPLALPEVHERIVPLRLDITRFGDGGFDRCGHGFPDITFEPNRSVQS